MSILRALWNRWFGKSKGRHREQKYDLQQRLRELRKEGSWW